MLRKFLRILLLIALIFAVIVGYKTWTKKGYNDATLPKTTQQQQNKQSSQGNSSEHVNATQRVTTGPSLEERKTTKYEKSALKSMFLAVMPDKAKWPVSMQKTYLLFNMEDVIEPLRESPNWTRISHMNRDIPKAIMAIEDHNFYNHGAVAMSSIVRAFLTNISAGQVVEGGSTITQQLVKNVFLTHDRTMSRKAEELLLSLMLEHQYTKDEILEMYLNTTYFGAGATGVKQASLKYFDKVPSNVNLSEAAVLASLPYAPTALNPLENPDDCHKRQFLVLQEMLRYGFINQGQYDEAKATPVWLTNGKHLDSAPVTQN